MHDARSAPQSAAVTNGINLAAVYGSLAVIAAIVFGTLSFHPF